jgi:hypothetical protein
MYDTNAGSDVSQFYKFISTGGGTSQAYGFTVSNGGSDAAMGLWGLNSASKRLRIAGILGQYTSNTAGSEASVMTFSTMGSGVLSERARINSSGNMGIGTTSPNTRLSVVGAGDNSTVAVFGGASGGTGRGLRIATGIPSGGSNNEIAILDAQSDQGVPTMAFQTAGTERARIQSNGIFLLGRTAADIGTNGFRIDPSGSIYSSIATGNETNYVYSTSAAAYRFYVNAAGTVFATTTTISAISDIRFKENVRDLDSGLAEVMALKPRLYDWKEGKGANIKNARGFIAQEFETVFPDLIDEWKDEAPEGEAPYKSVRQDLIPVLVKAIQEQQAIIESLKARLDAANL